MRTEPERMRIVNLLLVAALWIGSALVWPSLPGRASSLWSWFMLPATATLVVVLLGVVKRLTRNRPGLISIPGREQLMALPPERQAPVIARAGDMMEGTITIMLLIFCAVQAGLWQAAHGGSTQAMLVVILPLALLSTPLVLGIWLPRISSELERQVREHRAAGGSVPS